LYLALKALVASLALVTLSPLLGLLVVSVVPALAIAYAAGRKRTRQASYELQRVIGQANAIENEYLSAHAVVKAFGLEHSTIAVYRDRLLDLVRLTLRLTLAGARLEATANMGSAVGQLVVLGVGGYAVMTGEMTVGTLLASAGLLAAVFAPITALTGVGQTVQKAGGALRRVTELLDEPVTIADRPGAVTLPSVQSAIVFEDVTFGYDEREPMLQGLNLTIPVGAHVAIVGPSGSGKTTLANLLMRFWDPQQGRVTIDGRDLRDVSLASLRDQIGLVFQDTFVFDAAIRENIALARPGATDADVRAAAGAARLRGYIDSLPAGFDTILGERGVRMSGGQRQRLALARVLLRRPRVLILDEATSALDTRTEREILDALDSLGPTHTRISITHRLALAAAADWIVVLDHGRVVEQGRHAELVSAGGLYQRLHQEQDAHYGPHPRLVRVAGRPATRKIKRRAVAARRAQPPRSVSALRASPEYC
jgi:ABC-type multidrug transport system fused ATPase/permease subunit